MKIQCVALAIACTLLLAGCLPVTSKTPVGTTAGLGTDPALYGTWIGHSEDQPDKGRTDKGVVYFHFLQGKDGALSVLWVAANGLADDSWESFSASTAKLGANRYMNAAMTSENGKPTDDQLKNANIPLRYTLKGKKLTLYLLDEDKVKAAIKAGKIAGTIEPGDSGDVKITADAAALDAFFATPQAAKLFKVFVVLKKAE
jgi:hypothetical protein